METQMADKTQVVEAAAAKLEEILGVIKQDPTRIRVIAALMGEVIDALKIARQSIRSRQ
jgi:hypothetical protein